MVNATSLRLRHRRLMATRLSTTLADYHITNGKVIGLNEAAFAALRSGRTERLLSERIAGSQPNPSDTRFSMAEISPLLPPHDRGHDGPQSVAGDAAILPQRRIEVQSIFWPVP